jgi:hypothetical protein
MDFSTSSLWTRGIGQPELLDWKFIPGLNYLSNAGRIGLSKHRGNQEILCTNQQSQEMPLTGKELLGGPGRSWRL